MTRGGRAWRLCLGAQLSLALYLHKSLMAMSLQGTEQAPLGADLKPRAFCRLQNQVGNKLLRKQKSGIKCQQ